MKKKKKKTMDHVQHTHNDSICNIMTYLDSSSDKSSFKASITVAWGRIIENLKSDVHLSRLHLNEQSVEKKSSKWDGQNHLETIKVGIP